VAADERVDGLEMFHVPEIIRQEVVQIYQERSARIPFPAA
jgi:hypothetical protein